MCDECGEANYQKRTQRCDLRGKVGVVTGGRTKIGFEIALILLRNGCEVLVTTRFPKTAAGKYAALVDFKEWSGRLHIYGVDFKDKSSLI